MIEAKKIIKALSFSGLVFLGFLLLFDNRIVLPIALQVAGRWHTLLLHFPIVLICLVLLVIFLNDTLVNEPRWKSFEAFAVLTTVITAILGWFLSKEQTDAGNGLLYHKWSGSCLAFMCYVFCFYRDRVTFSTLSLRLTIVVILIALMLTGHWGGTITHGENYLTANLTAKKKEPLQLSQVTIFKDIIQPILVDKCGNCHKESVKKGGLSLWDSVSIVTGGKNGHAIVRGDLTKSILYQRLILPMTDKKHMPLSDKPQLSSPELSLMAQWIRSGAPFDQLLVDRPITDSLRLLSMPFVENRLAKVSDKVYEFAAVSPEKIAGLSNNYRVVKQLGMHSPALSVAFYGRANYSFDQLKGLEPIATQVVHVNLAKMPVTNEQLAWLSRLENLEELNLNYTDIDDQGLQALTALKQLHALSLVGTKTSLKGISQIAAMPSLKWLYVWNTNLAITDMQEMQKKFPKLMIETGFQGADTLVIPLNQPMIKTPGGFFTGKVNIDIKHVIKNVALRYTLNGQEPDSASQLYQQPFDIDSSCVVKVKAFKKGWMPSRSVSSQYYQAGIPIVSAHLLTAPDPKYALHADKILVDLDAGDPGDFGTRSLGYQKNEALVVLDLGKTTLVHALKVLNLQNLGAYIFPPVQMQVWGSHNQHDWQLLTNKSFSMPDKLAPASTPLLTLNFAPVQYRYLKFSAKPIAKLPLWHPGKGQPGWFFMSELVVN